jgi:hypothetical protein
MKNGMDTQPIVDRMQARVIRMLADTEFKQKLLVQGLELNAGRCRSGKFIDEKPRKRAE